MVVSTIVSYDSVVMIPSKFHPQVIFTSETLIWIKEWRTFIHTRVDFCESTNVNFPIPPWKRKAHERYEIGTEEDSHSATVEDYYCFIIPL